MATMNLVGFISTLVVGGYVVYLLRKLATIIDDYDGTYIYTKKSSSFLYGGSRSSSISLFWTVYMHIYSFLRV